MVRDKPQPCAFEDYSLCAIPALRDMWYGVIDAAQLGDKPVNVMLLGLPYVLWRGESGTVSAAVDRCPHRHAPLSAGFVKGDAINCIYHGWRFDGRGACIGSDFLPATETPFPSRWNLSMINAEERYGLIWLCPGTPSAPIPQISEENDAAYERVNTGRQIWRCSATRIADNFLDFSHVPTIHAATLSNLPLPSPEAVRHGHDGSFEGGIATGDMPGIIYSFNGWSLPFTTTSVMRFADGQGQRIMMASAPIDDAYSTVNIVVWKTGAGANDLSHFALAVGEEDRGILERITGPLPLDVAATATGPTDRLSTIWRQKLKTSLREPEPA